MMHDQKFIDNAAKELAKKDPVLAKVIPQVKIEPQVAESYFIALVEAIVSQQLSVKAANTIWDRLKRLLPDERVTPEGILALPDQAIRDAGISWSKIRYIKDLAEKTLESGIVFEQF